MSSISTQWDSKNDKIGQEWIRTAFVTMGDSYKNIIVNFRLQVTYDVEIR